VDPIDAIERLTSLRGGAGFETEIVTLLSSEMRRLGAAVDVYTMGNVIGRLGAAECEYSVMVCAHMDEVSLIVKYIDDAGLIYFDPIGTINSAVLPSTPVEICTEKGVVPGLIVARSRHLLNPEEMAAGTKLEDIWIEVGARCEPDMRAVGISLGDNVVFRPNFRQLRNGYFTSKSIDNRIGCAVLLALIELLSSRAIDYRLYVVGCAQEEVGSRGAGVAARALQPHIALVIDTVSAAEPMIPARRASAIIGGGPCCAPWISCRVSWAPSTRRACDAASQRPPSGTASLTRLTWPRRGPTRPPSTPAGKVSHLEEFLSRAAAAIPRPR
jgi:putative aminopeptidase FrvX